MTPTPNMKTLEEIVKEHKGLTYGLPMQGYSFSELVYYANILAKQESIEFCQDVLNNIEVNGVRLMEYQKVDASELYELFQQSKANQSTIK